MSEDSPIAEGDLSSEVGAKRADKLSQRGEVMAVFTVASSALLARVCGSNDIYLQQLGQLSGTKLFVRGDTIYARDSDSASLKRLQKAVEKVCYFVQQDIHPEKSLLQSLLVEQDFPDQGQLCINATKVFARNQRQKEYLQAIQTHQLTFALGPAGTGKTYLAVAVALEQLLSRRRRVLVLSRPVLEAGENLGFLPGSYMDKIDPYLRPLYDSVIKLVGAEKFERLRQNQQIEIAPLAYMRGRTLDNAFIILDEAQNSSKKQMKLFLTRLGEDSTVVVTGDPSQIDLPRPSDSGLAHAALLLRDLPFVSLQYFEQEHVVRSRLVQQIVAAYAKEEARP